MRYFISTLLLLTLLIPAAAGARSIIADANPRKIDINQNFKGMNLLVYGTRNDAGNIVIVVRGPREKQVLRKKGKVLGLWTNVENIELNSLYSYYAVASMRPLSTIQNDNLLKKLELGQDNISLEHEEDISPKKRGKIKESIIELMQQKGLYSKEDYEISFWGETLFRSFINFPKNITHGIYNIDIYLISDGLLHSYQTMPIIVEKVGLEAFINNLALAHPLVYGMLSVLMALIIGGGVAYIFSRNRKPVADAEVPAK